MTHKRIYEHELISSSMHHFHDFRLRKQAYASLSEIGLEGEKAILLIRRQLVRSAIFQILRKEKQLSS